MIYMCRQVARAFLHTERCLGSTHMVYRLRFWLRAALRCVCG